jgi:hypothetical protein
MTGASAFTRESSFMQRALGMALWSSIGIGTFW